MVNRYMHSIIKDDRKISIGDPKIYNENKKQYRLRTNIYSIRNLLDVGGIYASRSETNNRVHHNLTEMNSKLLQCIQRHEHLIEIDLANSQFAFLAHWMQEERIDTSDFRLF